MSQLTIVAALLVVAIAFAVVSSRTITAAAQRDELGRHRFLSAFASRGLPAELLVRTYEALSRRTMMPGRQLGPATRLADDLGLGLVDAEDLALLIAARCEGRIPCARDLDELGRSVHTVEDLVYFLAPFCLVEMAA